MYRVIKLPLYIFLNSSRSRGVGEDLAVVKDKCASCNFSLQERFPDTLLQDRNIPEKEKTISATS